MISEKKLTELATLSKLKFTDEELKNIKQDLEKIVGFMDKLKEVNLDEGIDQFDVKMENNLRDGEPLASLSLDDVFKNAKNRVGDEFVVGWDKS